MPWKKGTRRHPVRLKLVEERDRVGVLGDFRRMFQDAPHLKRWITVACLSRLPLAMALQGFYPIMNVVTSSMSLELVPLQCMGRWSGVLGVFAGLVTVPAPLIAGLIWRYVGPAYIFVIPSALDLALRIPLLTAIPETLWRQEL